MNGIEHDKASSQPVARWAGWPFERWPEQDRLAWTQARDDEDLNSDPGAAADWRPATCRAAMGGYGRWLGFLDREGRLDPQTGPADRMSAANVNIYVTWLKTTCASITVANYVAILEMTIRAMAPEGDWRWLRSRQAGLLRRAVPARNKRARIVAVAELLALGEDLMVAAEAETSRALST
jgi:integrase/recombinase XerD